MIVRSMAVLKEMEKAGHVTLHGHTGTEVRWYGGPVRAWYVDDGKRSFEFCGRKYETRYVDGCFFPYVFEVKG